MRHKFYDRNNETLQRALKHNVVSFEQKLKIQSMKDKVGTILETRAPSNISYEKRKLSTPELNTLVHRLHRTKKQLLTEEVKSLYESPASMSKTTKTEVGRKTLSKTSNGPSGKLVEKLS